MAMTKKEQSEMESLRKELRIAKAMRFTPTVQPDVPIPTAFGEMSKGWWSHWYCGSWRAEPACSTSVSHAFGRDDEATSQGGAQLYSSRLLALQACRNYAERDCARWLACLDAEIEAEQAKGKA
jgi:hypothetical protein